MAPDTGSSWLLIVQAATAALGLDAPGPRDSWTEGTPHFHSACYEGALSGIGGWRANPRI
jgi:hypothetical protein